MFLLLPDSAVTPRDEVQVSRLTVRDYLLIALITTIQLPYETGVPTQLFNSQGTYQYTKANEYLRQKDLVVAI
jgi:hypothetical protein